MGNYIIRHLLASVLVVYCVLTLVFFMIHLVPGDPVMAMVSGGESGGVTGEKIEWLREQLGLNDPIHVQYGRFLYNAARGDLGRSLYTKRPVVKEVLERFPSTLRLAFASMGLAITMGLVLGTISALRPNSWIDTGSMIFALVGVSMPKFWFGILFILLFCVKLEWFPITGQGGLKHLVLPALVLGLSHAAIVARLTRSSLLEVMGMDYITTGRAKGLSERLILLRHALKNAMIPVITVLGVQIGSVLSGTVVLEVVFARPGVGRLMVNAILGRDFPVVQGAVFLIALAYVLANLIVDVSYAFFDPRIRYD